jgi:hypothetical protein
VEVLDFEVVDIDGDPERLACNRDDVDPVADCKHERVAGRDSARIDPAAPADPGRVVGGVDDGVDGGADVHEFA